MAVAHVQSKSSAVTSQNQTQITANFDSATVVDNWIYAFIFWQDTAAAGAMSQTVSTVVGGTGNTYAGLTQWQNTANTGRAQIWRVKNQHAAAHTITVTFSAAIGNRITLNIVEVSGAHTSDDAIEQASIGQGTTGTSLNAGNVTSLEENSLSLSAIHVFSTGRTFSAPSVGFTLGNTQSALGAVAYCQQPSIGTYGATWSWSGGNATNMGLHIIISPPDPITGFPTTGTPTTLSLRDLEMNKGLN